MTDKQLFKQAFWSRMAERGYSPSDLERSLEKQAAVGDVLGGIGAAASSILDKAPQAMIALGLIPVLGGSMTGWVHSRMNDVSEEDVEQEKMRNIIAKYKEKADDIRTAIARKKWRKN